MQKLAVSLRIKRFRRRFGITAPKVAVRGHYPWFLGALFLSLLLSLILGGVLLLKGGGSGGAADIETLKTELRSQQEELIFLRSTAGTGQNAVSIERAAQRQLLNRISVLEHENAALKEDMLIFERLIPSPDRRPAVRIESFRVIDDTELSGNFRYRLLLAYQQGAQDSAEFQGSYQVVARYRVGNQSFDKTFPEKREGAVAVRHFLRREGLFELPKDAALLSAEVRVFQGDTLKTKRTAE